MAEQLENHGKSVEEKRELTCIGCPLGCPLTVELSGGAPVRVMGNTCKKGEEYAIKEVTNPERILTSIVRVTGGSGAVISVKTTAGVPKGCIPQCMKEIHACTVKAPVRIGDILIKNIAGTSADVAATRAME
ncbi:MAG: DUF1667 domain-containing protein [Lachnospiraceae bacterium]|nr:DUF1667 domain-containing protein [Lachnospiraceae bacterium]